MGDLKMLPSFETHHIYMSKMEFGSQKISVTPAVVNTMNKL